MDRGHASPSPKLLSESRCYEEASFNLQVSCVMLQYSKFMPHNFVLSHIQYFLICLFMNSYPTTLLIFFMPQGIQQWISGEICLFMNSYLTTLLIFFYLFSWTFHFQNIFNLIVYRDKSWHLPLEVNLEAAIFLMLGFPWLGEVCSITEFWSYLYKPFYIFLCVLHLLFFFCILCSDISAVMVKMVSFDFVDLS